MRGCIETLSLSALLVINLSFMVLLMLGLCTVLVLAGVDEGFLYHDGQVSSVVHWPLSIPSAS